MLFDLLNRLAMLLLDPKNNSSAAMFQPFHSWIVEMLMHLVVNLVRHPAVDDPPKSFRPFEGRIRDGTAPNRA